MVLLEETDRIAHLAHCATRPPLAQQRVQQGAGKIHLRTTPPDPAAGPTQLALDPLDLMHRLAQQIPDPRQHIVRYPGACAYRSRRLFREAVEEDEGGGAGGPTLDLLDVILDAGAHVLRAARPVTRPPSFLFGAPVVTPSFP